MKRLRIDRVDLYQIHWSAEHIVPVEEAGSTMAEVADEGLARHIGVSNFDRTLVERCLAIRQVDSVQNRLSLLAQRDRDSLLPSLAEQGIGYLGYSPLAFGLLTGSITRETTFEPTTGGAARATSATTTSISRRRSSARTSTRSKDSARSPKGSA